MFPIAPVLGGLESIYGIFSDSAAQAAAQRARQQAIAQLGGELDSDYQNLVARNRNGLYSATGTAGDAVQQLGRRLGSSLAGAGVYNSSATAGALQNAQNAATSQLTGLARNNNYDENSLLNQNRRYLAGMQYNLANQQYGEATNNLAGSRNGLASFLGQLGQYGLAQTGSSQARNGLTRAAGGPGGASVLDPAAASYGGANTGTFPGYGGSALGPIGGVNLNNVGLGGNNLMGASGYGNPAYATPAYPTPSPYGNFNPLPYINSLRQFGGSIGGY